jgi:hypothetical protein
MNAQNGITRRNTLLGATSLGASSAAGLPIALAQSAASAQPNTLSTFRPANFKEQLLYQRAFEAVLWALPVADTLVMRRAQRERGMKEGAVFYFENRPTGKTEVITFNNETPYVFGTLTTRNGPLVIDVPAAGAKAKLSGSIFDLWYFPMEDVGPAGADQGKGGKYLVLPPDNKETVPNGYIPLPSRTYDVHMLFRSIPADEGDDGWRAAVAYAKTLKIYPLSEAGAPKPTEFIDATAKPFHGTPNFDLSYFDYVDETVQTEPVFEHDKVMMGVLASIGIQKGKPFKPDSGAAVILAATYLATTHDANDKVLDPAQTYRVQVPKDVPIDDFWELIAYSIQTRSYIDTAANRIAVSSKNLGLQKNADGSVDVYLGPSAPAGKEANLVSTKPGEGYFLAFRFYGPRKAFYDRAWTPSDVERIS